uniref:Uncharacterized protein n=1 Tax=Arundo donax TaxID=35708 RepID=A0A0A9GPI2_ARUDO
MGSPVVAPGDILAIPLPGKLSHIGWHQGWNQFSWQLQKI